MTTCSAGAVQCGINRLADCLPETAQEYTRAYARTFGEHAYAGGDPSGELLGVEAGLKYFQKSNGSSPIRSLIDSLIDQALALLDQSGPNSPPMAAQVIAPEEPLEPQSIFEAAPGGG